LILFFGKGGIKRVAQGWYHVGRFVIGRYELLSHAS
jgi:hypothetical protein